MRKCKRKLKNKYSKVIYHLLNLLSTNESDLFTNTKKGNGKSDKVKKKKEFRSNEELNSIKRQSANGNRLEFYMRQLFALYANLYVNLLKRDCVTYSVLQKKNGRYETEEKKIACRRSIVMMDGHYYSLHIKSIWWNNA